LFPAAYVLLQKLRQAAWDWWVFGGLFLLSGLVLLADKFATKKASLPASPTSFRRAEEKRGPESTALWKNSGNLFWLGHDLMYSMQVALRGLPREEVLRALRQSCYHLDHLGLRSDNVGHLLFDLRAVAEATQTNKWNDAFRGSLAQKIGSAIGEVGALAAQNQKDFESDIHARS